MTDAMPPNTEARKPRVLLTGFEPFGGMETNPSGVVVINAAQQLTAQGIPTESVILPVTFRGASERLKQAMAASNWDLIVCVGVAPGRTKVGIERVAINVDDARIADNGGASPIDEPIVAEGPAAYFATLPVKRAFAAVTELGIPVEVSNTAGTYVCNHVFYKLMHALAGATSVRGGFVHIPLAEDLGEAVSTLALTAVVEATLRSAGQGNSDLRIRAGHVS